MSLVALLLVVSLFATSCGGDDDENADDDKTTTTENSGVSIQTTPTTAEPKVPKSFSGGDKAAFCAAWADMSRESNVVINTSDANAVRTKYTKIGDIAKRLLASASNETKDEIQTAIRINDEVIAVGNLKPFDSDESKQIGSKIAAYASRQCPDATTTTVK